MSDFIANQAPPSGFWLWVILHKFQIKRVFSALLIAVSVFLWGYGLYGLADWFFLSGVGERRAIASLSENLVNYSVRQKANPLEVRGVTLLANSRYDAFAVLKNINSGWSAAFEYRFALPGEETKVKTGFILPGEQKYIYDLGIQVKGKPKKAELELLSVRWSRIIKSQIPDYGIFQNARLAFDISKPEYTPALQVAGRAVSRATFTVINKSAFSYFEVPLQVILYRGNTVAAITVTAVTNFQSGEERQVDVTWFETFAGITRVEVKPDLNILDPSIYIR